MRASFHSSSRRNARSELFVLNVGLVTIGWRIDESLRAVARARGVPGRDADRRDGISLPGRGRHQALSRRCSDCSSSSSAALDLSRRSSPISAGWRSARRAGGAKLGDRLLAGCSSALRDVVAAGIFSRRSASWRSSCSRSQQRATCCRPTFCDRACRDDHLDVHGTGSSSSLRADRTQAHRQRSAGAAAQVTQIAASGMARQGPRHRLRLRPQRADLARLLEAEDISFVAMDTDPQRVREAAADGRQRRLWRCERARGAWSRGLRQSESGRDHVRRHAGRAQDHP